jgi:hypothetical protein
MFLKEQLGKLREENGSLKKGLESSKEVPANSNVISIRSISMKLQFIILQQYAKVVHYQHQFL